LIRLPVATRKTFRGTHTGEFLGVPPTGRDVSFDVIDILRLEDGKPSSTGTWWTSWD
jgi:predicted ester cyclase